MSRINRLRGSFRKNRLGNQLDDELQFHIEMRTKQFIAEVVPREEASYRARRLFGNQTLLKERTRDPFGVMSYLATQRTSEIGIRMALGANARDVLASVVLSGLRPVFIGAVLGLAGSAGLSAILHATPVSGSMDLLFGMSKLDPVAFIGLSAFVACVAAVASAIPARRAIRVDPVVALKYE